MVVKNKKIINDLIKHLELGKPIANKRKKPISKRTVDKYKTYLNHLDRWINKDFNKLTQADVDKFRTDLKKDKIRKKDGKPYSKSAKFDIEVKFLRVLLNYLGKYELAQFFTEFREMKEVPALTREEVENVVAQSKLRDKVVWQVLFDGGFRAEEFLNVKFSDVKEDSLKSNGYYKIRITKSKTLPRTVGLVLPISTEVIRDWLATNPGKVGTNLLLVDLSYHNLNMIIKRAADKILKKRATPHILRHSSATHYCHHLGKYQLCKRFGWGLNSDMPERYIDREGIEDEEVNNKVIHEEKLSFQRQVNQFKEQMALRDEKHKSEIKELHDKLRVLLKSDVISAAAAIMEKKKKS